MSELRISRISLVPGIGGFWVNDQPAIQMGAEPDGFFFKGKPVSPGFSSIREPSVAYCVMVELDYGQMAYGDCDTVLNAGYAGRPRPLRTENIPRMAELFAFMYDGKAFNGFRDAVALLDQMELERDVATPVAYGVSQALLSAAALTRRITMAEVLKDE